MAAPKNRLVGIGAINGDNTIDDSSVIKLKPKGKFKETDRSNTSLLGVGAINGNNIIKENSFNKLTTIGTGDQKDVIIIEPVKEIDQLKKKTTGSNNVLFGIGAINGNNTLETCSFTNLETIAGEEDIKTKAKRRKYDSNNNLYGYACGELNGPCNTTKIKHVPSLNATEKP